MDPDSRKINLCIRSDLHKKKLMVGAEVRIKALWNKSCTSSSELIQTFLSEVTLPHTEEPSSTLECRYIPPPPPFWQISNSNNWTANSPQLFFILIEVHGIFWRSGSNSVLKILPLFINDLSIDVIAFDVSLQLMFCYILLFNWKQLLCAHGIKCHANLDHWVVNFIYFGPQVHGVNYIMYPPQEISDNDCETTAFWLKNSQEAKKIGRSKEIPSFQCCPNFSSLESNQQTNNIGNFSTTPLYCRYRWCTTTSWSASILSL